MSNEKVSALPTVANALAVDVIYAIQGGVSVQETLQQVLNLGLSNTILSNAGNPNGALAGSVYQLCWDTANNVLYVCTTTGNSSTAVWTLVSNSASMIIIPALGGTGVASPTAHTIPVAEGSANFNFLGPLTNGQIMIGNTGADPSVSGITAGSGINVSNGAGTITITATGSGAFNWTNVTGTSQTMSVNSGYIANNGSLVSLTLPTSANIGDEIDIMGLGIGGWTIVQPTGVSVNIGSAQSTPGGSGSVSSTAGSDCTALICTVTNTRWAAYSVVGNLTVV